MLEVRLPEFSYQKVTEIVSRINEQYPGCGVSAGICLESGVAYAMMPNKYKDAFLLEVKLTNRNKPMEIVYV